MREQIKQLSEKEKVRKKISVWLGSSNHIAVLHSIKELVGNSVDEINKGNGDTIKLTLHNRKTISIQDNCKGLPFEGVNENGVENYKLLTETLFAGTKYENGIENDNYTVGTNGVFLTVLTYASEDVEFEVSRPNGNIYYASYHKGNIVEPLKVIGKSDKTYTKIKFTLDDEVFEENYYTFDELCSIADEQASLINGQIEVCDELSDKVIKYKYDDGIKGLLDYRTNSLSEINQLTYFNKDISFEVKREGSEEVKVDDIKIEMVFKYTKEFENPTQIEFLNGSNLIHHGTIYDGLINGLRLSINKYLKDNGTYNKNEKQISKDDVAVGLNYVVNFKSYFPIFANQTKFASYVTYYKEVMQQAIEDFFEVYSIENKMEMNNIATQILNEKRAREKAEKTRLDIRKKLQVSTSGLRAKIENLNDCDMKKSELEEREAWLCEGLSAASTITEARDSRIMGTYALSGRFIASLKNSVEDVLNNKPAMGIIQALGCGIEIPKSELKKFKDVETFDINKLRYGKIIIACDQDFIGFGIGLSLVSFFYKFMPTLLKQNRVYISMSPRYEIRHKDELIFAYNEKEKEEITAKLENEGKKFTVGIVKGLGELDKDVYWNYVMNPEHRILKQLVYDEQYDEDISYYFNTLIGEDIVERKKFVKSNITNLDVSLID